MLKKRDRGELILSENTADKTLVTPLFCTFFYIDGFSTFVWAKRPSPKPV
jgi:hypothetical protein